MKSGEGTLRSTLYTDNVACFSGFRPNRIRLALEIGELAHR